MSTTKHHGFTLNVIDASPQELWSERTHGLVDITVKCLAEVPASDEVLASGLWVLAPDSFEGSVGVALVGLTRSLPESAHVMIVREASDTGSASQCGAAVVSIEPGEGEGAIMRALKSMVRTHRAEHALDSALKFPAENPNPVLSLSKTGALLYANPAATVLLDESDEYGVTLRHRLQDEAQAFPDSTNVVVELHDSTYGFRFEADEQSGRLNVYGIDITENLLAIESQMAMEKHSRNKDIFLAAMSHELRTPLNAVLSCAEAMKEGAYGPLGLEQLSAVNTIERSGKHLLSLISDILDISKIEAGRLEIASATLSVQSVCDAVVEIVRVTAEEKNISLSLTNETGISAFAGDPLRIKQVLLNLLSNAIKFTPNNGEVGLDVCEGEAPGTIAFRVWDTGPGISPVHADTIFKSFVQADGDVASSQPGTGLGLTIARHLTRLHGGELSLEKMGGPGAVFIVNLPIGDAVDAPAVMNAGADLVHLDTAASAEHESEPRPEKSDGDIERVLIAEDTDSSYQHLRDMLVSLGYTVERAFNGQEAIDMCDSVRPDLVLMDIDMPYVNGIDAIREIRQDAQYDAVPIIAVTAMSGIANEQVCLQAGANGFLAKPYPLRDLMMMMQRVSA